MAGIEGTERGALPGAVPRAPGLVVLGLVVVVGLLTGTVFYRWRRGASDAGLSAELARAPRTGEERVDLWLRYCGPQVHHRLAVVGRFAPDMPWLVTHAFGQSAGPGAGAAEIWGVACVEIEKDCARREGLSVVVSLPAPRRLASAELPGGRESRVPRFEAGAQPDGALLLGTLALHLLEELPEALERDIPGARLEIRVRAPAEEP